MRLGTLKTHKTHCVNITNKMENNLENLNPENKNQASTDKAAINLWKEVLQEINNLRSMDSAEKESNRELEDCKICVTFMDRKILNEKQQLMINSVLHYAIMCLETRLERDDNFMEICIKEQHRIMDSESIFLKKLTVTPKLVANPKTLGALARDTILDFVLKTILSQCKEHTRVLQERVVKMRDLQSKYLQCLRGPPCLSYKLSPLFLRTQIWKLEKFICDRKYFCIKQELFKVRYDNYKRRLRMRTCECPYICLARSKNDQSPEEPPVHIKAELITDLLGKSFVRSPKLTKKEHMWFDDLYDTLLSPAFK